MEVLIIKMNFQSKSLHAYVILIALIFLSSLFTYIIPAGSFERMHDVSMDRTVVVADSYRHVEPTPVAPFTVFHIFFKAISSSKTAELIFFLLLVSGTFEIILKTGCLTLLCENMMQRLKGSELIVIPIFVCLFSVFGFTMGLTTASVIFVPIGLSVAASARLPKLVGIAMVALGTNAGFTAGVFNPFSVGVAQSIAELPMFSGAWIRWITLVVLNLTTSLYLVAYAKRHRTEKTVSDAFTSKQRMPLRHRLVLMEFAATFMILTIGISIAGWDMPNIVVSFLVLGIAVGATAGFTVNECCDTFTEGCRKIMKGAIVIGLASTMRLILTDGNILDTITVHMTGLVYMLPPAVQLVGMFLFNAVLNFLVTSGSAKAALVMPILTPMADFLGLTRQSAVYAFQLGDGLTNLASPISTTLNGVLALSESNFGEWFRFYIPLVGIHLFVGTALTVFAQLSGY